MCAAMSMKADANEFCYLLSGGAHVLLSKKKVIFNPEWSLQQLLLTCDPLRLIPDSQTLLDINQKKAFVNSNLISNKLFDQKKKKE